MWSRLRLSALLLSLVASLPFRLSAQSGTEPGLHEIPFDRWFAAGEREQIAWQVTLREPWMRADLRLAAGFSASIRADELNRRSPTHDLFLLARVSDASGRWLPTYGLLSRKIERELPRSEDVTFSVNFLVRPGEYKLALILYDRTTGLRNLAVHPLRVAPIKDDPLPDAFRDLPAAEFTPPAENLDRFLEPQVRSRLWLPVTSPHPLRVEVLINFGLSRPASSPRSDNLKLWILARTLKLMSQLQILRGSLHLTGIDASNREPLFSLDRPHDIPWSQVREGLARAQPGTVTASALQGGDARFLRDAVLALLRPSSEDSSTSATSASTPASAEAPANPRRILILISNPVDFAQLPDGVGLPRSEQCNCRVFYLRYRFVDPLAPDRFADLLNPLRPRLFEVYKPEDVRKALATLIKELAAS